MRPNLPVSTAAAAAIVAINPMRELLRCIIIPSDLPSSRDFPDPNLVNWTCPGPVPRASSVYMNYYTKSDIG